MPAPNGPTRVVTFYSYKGGVGRTMALVNTAAAFAQQGLRVLLVDFDLEAPGMTHFFAREVRRRPKGVHKDSLDFLLDAKRSLAEAEGQSMEPDYRCSLAEYTIPISLPKRWLQKAPQGIPYSNGRMDLIPATLEPRRSAAKEEGKLPPDYLDRLQDLDLGSLFLPGGPGHRFGAHVRSYFRGARFEAPGDILFALRESVQAAYDLVLIDSRTGLNEVAGFSIGTVADALVICCGLNQQNIEGTRYFMKKIGLFDRKRAKPFLIAVGPVPPWQTAEAQQRRQALKKALHLLQDDENHPDDLLDRKETPEAGSGEIASDYPWIVEVPYHPVAALREPIFVVDSPTEPIALAYQRLAARLQSSLPLGPALEGNEGLSFINLIQNPSPSVRTSYVEWLADRLPGLRLRGSPRLKIPSFPTACGVCALFEKRPNISWEDLERIPLAAAVAALRTQSAAPFERAWNLIPPLSSERKRFLAVGLIFFQSMTCHPVPQDSLQWLNLKSEEGEKRDVHVHLTNINAHLGSLRLASNRRSRRQLETQGSAVLEQSLAELQARSSIDNSFWREFIADELNPFKAFKETPEILRVIEHWASGTLAQSAESLQYLRTLYRRPENLQDEVSPQSLSNLVLLLSPLFSHSLFGFWPAPLAATAAALEGGADAMDEILAWLYQARSMYGYTWRVLVDWRYFEEVRRHPRFKAFLAEEDALVESIEGAIDRGEIPL